MKALILAAGNGTRLRPLTDKTPKCLLPIAGVPLLSIWLELCAKHEINEVVINAHSNSDAVNEFVSKYRGPISITISDERILLGSGGTLYANRRFFDGESSFWIFYGDVLTTVDLEQMLNCHKRMAQPVTIGLHEVPNPQECGIVDLEHKGIVRSFIEKPLNPRGNLAFSGVMLGTQQMLRELPPSARDIGFDVLPLFAGRMAGHVINEFLMDIGTVHSYNTANQLWPVIRKGLNS